MIFITVNGWLLLIVFLEDIHPCNDEYTKQGFKITQERCTNTFLNIKYHNHKYKAKIIKIAKEYFWKLTPYRDTYFTTAVENENSFELVLCAIKEHEKSLLPNK